MSLSTVRVGLFETGEELEIPSIVGPAYNLYVSVNLCIHRSNAFFKSNLIECTMLYTHLSMLPFKIGLC